LFFPLTQLLPEIKINIHLPRIYPPTPQGGLKKKYGFKVPPRGFRGKNEEEDYYNSYEG